MNFRLREFVVVLLLITAVLIEVRRERIYQIFDTFLQNAISFLTDLHHWIQSETNDFNASNVTVQGKIELNYNLSQYEYECPQHWYRTRIIERTPLIIYIEQFLTPNEIQHLIELTKDSFERSMVFHEDGTDSIEDYRTSRSAIIDRQQTPVVKCIERRFSEFQGGIDVGTIEPLQVVKYTSNQEFKPHFDWFSKPELFKNGGQRVTTFFTYLLGNCSMGETEFSEIPFVESIHYRFCDILTCDKKSSRYGLRFRPIPGNSIFWFNIDLQGQGDYLTYHAGHPPGSNGQKIGLNTWTREDIFIAAKKHK